MGPIVGSEDGMVELIVRRDEFNEACMYTVAGEIVAGKLDGTIEGEKYKLIFRLEMRIK